MSWRECRSVGERVVLFATARPSVLAQVLPATRERWADAGIRLVLRDPYRTEVWDAAHGMEVVSDKPARRLKFLAELRGQRFDHGVVVWGGEADHWPMKAAALVSRVRTLHVYNENGDSFQLDWDHLGTVKAHLSWRWKSGKGLDRVAYLGPLFQLYGATLGRVVGTLVLLGRGIPILLRRARG